jgi:hypothetical protein
LPRTTPRCALSERGRFEIGYIVDAVGNAELALRFLCTYDYDVVVLDRVMSEVSGLSRNVWPPGPRCIRRERKSFGPSCASVEGHDQGFVSFKPFDTCQTLLP